MKPQAKQLDAPLPASQFRGFILFFHAVILTMIGLTWYNHWRHIAGPPARSDFVLTILVSLLALIYIGCFIMPSLTPRVQLLGWKWWAYFCASVALVLGASRLEPAFGWMLIPFVGQAAVLPLRTSVPTCLVILIVHALNFQGAAAARWSFLLGTLTWFVLAFFLGRLVITSAERGGLIRELEAARRELEAARQRDAELAVFRERERLARELHDNLGHSLVTLTVQLEAAQRLRARDPARAGILIEEMQKLTRASMEDLRRSLGNLRAPGLGERQLADALRELCAESGKRLETTIDCQLADHINTLPPLVAETLWRVAQEGLTNVEKHARANRVAVELALQPGEVRLQINDNGVGLPERAEEKTGHYGLRGLRERVEGLGGSFNARTNGTGTVLEARLPLVA